MEPSGINGIKLPVPDPSQSGGAPNPQNRPKGGESEERPKGEEGQQSGEKRRPRASAVDKASLEAAERRVNDALKDLNFRLNFSIDREVDEVVVKVVDPESEEVIRELPPEEMRELAKRMEEVTGILLDERR